MIKAIIISEGGREAGYGHITRCLALSQCFRRRGITPLFIVNGDRTILEPLKTEKALVFNWLRERARLSALIKGADIAVIDSYLAGAALYRMISGNTKLSVYIDDNRRIGYPAGVIVNGSVYAKGIRYPALKGRTVLAGPEYILLREEFRRAPAGRTSDTVKRIMVTFGGEDKKRFAARVLDFLNERYPQVKKDAVIGSAFKDAGKLERLSAGNIRILRRAGAGAMRRAMAGSDMAVSAGGQTLNELARMGVPTVAFRAAANQRRNLLIWEERGFIKFMRRYDEKMLAAAIDGLADKHVRMRMSKAGADSVDGMGAERVVRAVLAAYYRTRLRMRRASPKDISEVYGLSNEPAVRRNSFNTGRIAWSEHVKWFKGALRDSNCVFFVFDADGEFSGQARFKIMPSGKEAGVSVSLVPQMRGLGLSSFILDRAIEGLFKARRDVRRVNACVKTDNPVSAAAFKGARFRFCGEKTSRGARVLVYRRDMTR